MVVVDDGQEWKVVDGARYCTGLAWRNDHVRTNRPLGICASLATAHLVVVPQQVGRIFVDATRTGPLERVGLPPDSNPTRRCFEHGRHRRLSMPLDHHWPKGASTVKVPQHPSIHDQLPN